MKYPAFRSGFRSLFVTGLCLMTLISMSAQSGIAEPFQYTGTLSYLDNTPVDFGTSESDDMSVTNLKFASLYAARVVVKKDSIFMTCLREGEHVLSFLDQEIVRFDVVEVDGTFQSSLSGHLNLPFNYIVKGDPGELVHVYSKELNLVQSHTIDESGYAGIALSPSDFQSKFMAFEREGQFIQPLNFSEIKPRDKGKLNKRRFYTGAHKMEARNDLVHNLDDHAYYAVQRIYFSDRENSILLLKKYDARNRKAALYPINVDLKDIRGMGKLNLDYKGNLALLFDGVMYRMSKTGQLSPGDDLFISPVYRFNNHFVKGPRWIIPVFAGVPMNEGGHQLTITCDVEWSVPNPEVESWHERKREINERWQGRSDPDGQKLKELEALGPEPQPPGFSKSGSKSCSESFEVVFDPESEYLWRMFSTLDKNNNNEPKFYEYCAKVNPAYLEYEEQKQKIMNTYGQDPESRDKALEALGNPPTPYCTQWKRERIDPKDEYYWPSGYDSESPLAGKTIKECVISVDGQAELPYTYIDANTGKGVMYADWDSEEQMKEAMEAAYRNAPRYIGFGEETNGWETQMSLFSPDQQLSGGTPLNLIEGPYPELRYKTWVVASEYPDRKEAEKHCNRPFRTSSGKYQCREEVIVKVCPDNFAIKMENGRVMTDYDALQCGIASPIENTVSGEEIVVEFSKQGYVTETRALSKRTLEAAEILLSGHIKDEQGATIEGALVNLRNIDAKTSTDDAGIYNLLGKASGKENLSEVMDITLEKIGIEISHEELGVYKDEPWGIVSDGFTTLELKVKAKGIRPNTVSVKQPELGQFVERTMLKVPLVLNGAGEGVLEYVPPEYLNSEQLTFQLPLKDTTQAQNGMDKTLWVAEVPVQVTYEDEEGKPGSFSFKIYVARPPVFLIHGFTGDESTWADLGGYLRNLKFNVLIHEYYKGAIEESTIPRQSKKLGRYIQEVRACYKNNGFYMTRIDIVAHSMGGLISRHYISNMARYGEKSGIVIPYNVKLSRDELAAQRYQKPVILNDVRKLIMVGTPNHGSSFIDGRIGHFTNTTGFHQLANAQLRSNSTFISELNKGEGEGRHLSPNVQYALLYGIRRVSRIVDFVPNAMSNQQALIDRPLAFDDGVVTTESAKLNGVVDFHFPQDRTPYNKAFIYTFTAPAGFIHSPAVEFAFSGDKSITTDEEIFSKAEKLLLEDIPRAPLKNAYARILRSEGDASLRYFSHHDWQKVEQGSNAKLQNPWCYFRTGEGSLSIAFYLDGHHWASMHLQPHTILQLEHAAPELVQAYLQQGKARFRSRKQGGGGFEIVLGEETETWYNFNPKARVVDADTDFIIEEGSESVIQSISGRVLLGVSSDKNDEAEAIAIGTSLGKRILDDRIEDFPLPETGWWSSIDTAYLPDEIVDPQEDESTPGTENLVVNGGFEEGPEFSQYVVLNVNDQIPGWMVTEGSVDVVDTAYKPAEGGRSLDLLGTTKIGCIQQVLNTVSGQYYLLSFELAGNPLGAPEKKKVHVGVGDRSVTYTFNVNGKEPQNMGWETKQMAFLAVADTTLLKFTGEDTEAAGGAGAMIDRVRVVPISEEEALALIEEAPPVQVLGEVAAEMSKQVLPIAGFTTLKISAEDDQGDPMESPYEVRLQFEDAEQLSFIHINSTSEVVDATGLYEASITVDEPDPGQFESLDKIPMEATLLLQMLHPESKDVAFEEKMTLPLGMTLIYGKTLGPDYQPRQEPVPPEFHEVRYQIANQADAKGNFYILFNTSLFQKDIEKFREHAERTQKIFSMDDFDFFLEWSSNCSTPFRYVLPDSLVQTFEPGQKVEVGIDGGIDLLSPSEQENRVKAMIYQFVEQMPLQAEKKSGVLRQLDALEFRYSATLKYPTFNEQLAYSNTLLIPIGERYWMGPFVEGTSDPAFDAFIHAMGHFLQFAIISKDRPLYSFLTERCNGSHDIWLPKEQSDEWRFDLSQYQIFSEAGADFFAYLLKEFIKGNSESSFRNSVYDQQGYLAKLNNVGIIGEILKKYQGHTVPGIVTAFLMDFYGEACTLNPTRVYSDFLMTQWKYGENIDEPFPATTLGAWLDARRWTPDETLLLPGIDIEERTKAWGLDIPKQALLFPLDNISEARVDIDDQTITDFSEIPAIDMVGNASIKVSHSVYKLIVPKVEGPGILLLHPGAELVLDSIFMPHLTFGTFEFHSPIAFETPLARCQSESGSYMIKLEDKDTFFEVFDGNIFISSEKDEKTIPAGTGVRMTDKGKIKKPKKLKEPMTTDDRGPAKSPFILGRNIN